MFIKITTIIQKLLTTAFLIKTKKSFFPSMELFHLNKLCCTAIKLLQLRKQRKLPAASLGLIVSTTIDAKTLLGNERTLSYYDISSFFESYSYN